MKRMEEDREVCEEKREKNSLNTEFSFTPPPRFLAEKEEELASGAHLADFISALGKKELGLRLGAGG